MNTITSILVQLIISLFFLIPHLFYKFWGKSMLITLVCGMWINGLFSFIYFSPSVFEWQGFILSFFAGFSIICFYIFIINKEKFSGIYINKEMCFSLFIGVIYVVIIAITTPKQIFSYYIVLVSSFVISPFMETIVCQYIVYKMIPQNISKKIMYVYFVFLSIIIALLHFEFDFISLFCRSVSFFFFYLIRYFYPKTNQLWITVLCHSSYNFVLMLIPILFQGLVK